jgi:hypothetical protein
MLATRVVFAIAGSARAVNCAKKILLFFNRECGVETPHSKLHSLVLAAEHPALNYLFNAEAARCSSF